MYDDAVLSWRLAEYTHFPSSTTYLMTAKRVQPCASWSLTPTPAENNDNVRWNLYSDKCSIVRVFTETHNKYTRNDFMLYYLFAVQENNY